ncbi:MAG TPA: lipid A biosynthesis acyltransferase, partial [Gammaproteobacteria bacterium]|nr:lipid A biosynthesis acyltransferase [Gammaproteobacteria bacterium]
SVVRKKIKMSGFEKVEQYQEQGKKVIILLLHNVGLEFAVAAISMEHAMTGPYKVMKNPVLNWLVVRSRMRFGRKHGIKLFTREDGLRPLIRETRAGKILVYLGDEDLGKKNAVFVPFFGVQKATIPVLGRLAKACDAVVLPCVCLYQPEERNYSVQLMPEIEGLSGDDDVADSLKMNQAIEQAIRLCPEQYMWTLRYFKTRPPGEASCYG